MYYAVLSCYLADACIAEGSTIEYSLLLWLNWLVSQVKENWDKVFDLSIFSLE